MQSDNISKNDKLSVKSDFSANGRIISILKFLELYLPEFPNKYCKSGNDNEWNINQELFRFLDIYSHNYLFQFIPEYNYKNRSKPDFGVNEKMTDEAGAYFYDQNSEHFFDIECKRLYHTTKSKQYVNGNTGGIQRFKENKHGVDLPYSAMIGYVEMEDFNYWHSKVNSWIDDESEKLRKISMDKIAKFQSMHQRQNSHNKVIELVHFWMMIGN